MEQFKMIRNVVSKSSFKEADDHVSFYKDKPALNRLNSACFIINSIFGTSERTKVNRSLIASRKHATSI